MKTAQAIAHRIRQLCDNNGITPNRLSTLSAVPQSTIKKYFEWRKPKPR